MEKKRQKKRYGWMIPAVPFFCGVLGKVTGLRLLYDI